MASKSPPSLILAQPLQQVTRRHFFTFWHRGHAGAALGFLSWEVVAWICGWGLWSSRRVSPEALTQFGSFALMFLGLLLGLGSRLFRRT